MLDLKNRRGDTLPWILFGLLLVAFVVFVIVAYLPTHNRVNKIHQYLGTNAGTDPANWSGLTGQMEKNNAFHREQYTKIACEFWKLNHPGQPVPVPCPPGDPSTKPPGGPTYP